MKSTIALCAFALTATFAMSSRGQTSTPSTEMTPPTTEPAAGAIKMDGPCKKDMDLLCPGITDRKEMHKCMHDNKKKVSKECTAKMKEMKKAMKGVHEACHEDAEKYCSDVKPGKGRMMECMKEHKDEVSQACKDKIENVKAKHGKSK